MYDWLCSRFPKALVNLGYAAWYAGLMILVLVLADKPMADFYYLHN